jgi:hypothetical protein
VAFRRTVTKAIVAAFVSMGCVSSAEKNAIGAVGEKSFAQELNPNKDGKADQDDDVKVIEENIITSEYIF